MGVEMAAATGVGTVGGAAAGIEVMFPRGHDFAAQDSILAPKAGQRPFAFQWSVREGGPPIVLGDQTLTSFSFKNCTVSDVMGMPNPGCGFDILNERAQPILSLAFERRDDAERARSDVAKAVAKADMVTRPGLTAAGEP
jgi:hypothetical protein